MEFQYVEGDKLYVVVRNDLTPGQQLAQAIHGFREFIADHPECEQAWYKDSNYICVLQVPDEVALKDLIFRAQIRGILYSFFVEPHYGDKPQITCAAFEPGEITKKFLEGLPLAGL